MKPFSNPLARRFRAFSLIELLVVIAIIALLAAMIFPAAAIIKQRAMRRKAEAELGQVITAIENYKSKLGQYPPDNPTNAAVNPLYYELVGTTNANNTYRTLDGAAQMAVATVPGVFGTGGFLNANRPGSADDLSGAQKFLTALNPGQYWDTANARLLTTSVRWPVNMGPAFVGAPNELNPIRYNSSSPTNNPKSYDLWVDVRIGNKTWRINNWGQPELSN